MICVISHQMGGERASPEIQIDLMTALGLLLQEKQQEAISKLSFFRLLTFNAIDILTQENKL